MDAKTKTTARKLLPFAAIALVASILAAPFVAGTSGSAAEQSEGFFFVKTQSDEGQFIGMYGREGEAKPAPAVATSMIELSGNLSSSARVGETFSRDAPVLDANGKSTVLRLTFVRTASGWTLDDGDQSKGTFKFMDGVQMSPLFLTSGGIFVNASSITASRTPPKSRASLADGAEGPAWHPLI